MTDADGLKAQLQMTRERLLATIAGVTEEQFKKRPAATDADPEPWCIAEVLAHLLDAEARGVRGVERALHEVEPAVTWWATGERQAQAKTGRLAPVPQLIHGLLAVRRDIDRLLVATSAANLTRRLIDAKHGSMTLDAVVSEYVIEHEAEHVAQIEAIKGLVGAKAVKAVKAAG